MSLTATPAPAQAEIPIASDPVETGDSELTRFRRARADGTPFTMETPAAPPAPPPAPVDAVAVASPPVSKSDEMDATGAPSKRQQYINELIRKQTIAEMRAQQLEERLAAIESVTPGTRAAAPTVAPTRPKPTEDQVGTQYATYGDYVEDLADWKVEQRDQARTHAEQGARAEQAHREALTAYETTVAAAKARHTDFDEVVTRPLPAPLTETIHNAILASAVGGELAYHLTIHPDEYLRIRALPVGRALMAMGAIEAQLVADLVPKPATAAPQSPAPPPAPMAPVGGSATAGTPDPKTMTLAEFRQLKPKFGMSA